MSAEYELVTSVLKDATGRVQQGQGPPKGPISQQPALANLAENYRHCQGNVTWLGRGKEKPDKGKRDKSPGLSQ